jgi:dTDP-4-amino-4,6-dideoxygalactose transaminase
VADRYANLLEGLVRTPKVIEGGVSTWAQYVIETDDRDALAAHLHEAGVPTAQYYPKSLHQQQAYRQFPVGAGGMGVSETVCHRVLALPMHPYLDGQTQSKIAGAVRTFAKAGG